MSCKRFDRRNRPLIFVASLFVALGLSAPLWGQSLTSGAIIGTVTDPTGAVVPNAQVTVTNTATGSSRTISTSAAGAYTASQLEPGEYKVSVSAAGFRTTEVGPIVVSVSRTANADVKLEVGAQTQTVEVTGAAQMIETSNPNTTTTVNARALADLPNPGNDLSYVAQIAPGAIMNTGGGYGNMEFNGLPATSTNFTVDGLDANDPFLNLNNSGATNLQLGLNAVDEASVNTLSYSVDQGRSGAAQANFVTKAGTNDWHGNAFETWNGARMNAVNWFVNANPTGTTAQRPFDNVNEFGGSVGGRVIRNKLFVFGDVEGLRISLPATKVETYPTQAYENYVLAQIPLGGWDPSKKVNYAPPPNPAAAISYYKQAFGLYGNPTGGVPIATSDCPILGDGTIVALAPGVATPHGTGCRLTRTFGLSNQTHDLFMKYRVDHDINETNRVWYAFEWEKGVQATYTDAVNPVFNAFSTQPQNGLSVGYTHVFSPTLVNEFNPGYYWYSALFQPTSFPAALKASPFEFSGPFTPIYGDARDWPQGRNVLDWQLIDNLTWTRNTHTFKFGENLRRSLVSDHDPGFETTPYINAGNLIQYAHDILGTYAEQGFSLSNSEPIGIADLDVYGQDTWKIKPNLTFTYGLRAAWNSNPVSQANHFARLNGSFYDITHDVNQPLNSVILTNQKFELAGTQRIQWQPRASFAWEVKPRTVLRMGAGLFSDVFPASLADNMLGNFPNKNLFFASWNGSQPIVATYAIPGSGDGVVNSHANDGLGNIVPANAALRSGFKSGVLSCAAANAPANCLPGQGYFAVPKGVFKYPYFAEWSATLQQQFSGNWIGTVQYVGTKATNMPYSVQANGFQTACPGCFSPYIYDPTFNGPDGRFGGVTQYWAGANSIYNGLQASFEKRFSHGLSVRVNYTWSHCIDTSSNEGAVTGGFDSQSQQSPNPGQLNLMRGNCDYDVRHSLNGSYVYQLPSPVHNRFLKQVFNGWQVSGDVFLHTGFPFSVYSAGYGAGGNGVFQASGPNGGTGFANPVPSASPYAKWQKVSTQSPGVPEIQWLNPNAFSSVVDPNTGSCTAGETFDPNGNALTTNDNASTCQYGVGGRNNVFAPGFAWTDIFISKNFQISERVKFRFDLQMYNAFNHMNPGFPGNGAGILQSPNTLTDAYTINYAVNPPTGILGSGLGGDNSVRMIAISGRLEF